MGKENIAIIGSGLMGHGIAQIFAVHGHDVVLWDMKQELLDAAIKNVRANLELMVSRGIVETGDAADAPGRIRTTTRIEDAAEGADFVIEAVIENMGIKQDLFQNLDRICKATAVLASNTSVMSITEIASTSKNRDRIVGTHFWNPPHLIPLVEVVQTEQASAASIDFTMDILKRVGKHPIHCKKDVPGFVANRMQHALWREALYIVEQGIADAATVDEAVRLSFGMRLPQLGPLENADMVGLDLTLAIQDYILKYLCDAKEASPIVRQHVEAGKLGFKTGQGLQTWTEAEAADQRRALQEYLLDVTVRTQGKQAR